MKDKVIEKNSVKKKKYEAPQLAVTEIATEDIIATSGIQCIPADSNFIGQERIEIDFGF